MDDDSAFCAACGCPREDHNIYPLHPGEDAWCIGCGCPEYKKRGTGDGGG